MPEPSDERGSLVVARGVEREDDELVSPDSSDGVTRSHDRLEPLGQRAEDGVPRAVPPDVVHVLEPVEVHDDEGERLFAALVVAECLVDAILEQHAVRKAGQRISERVRPCGRELPVQCDAAGAGEHSDSISAPTTRPGSEFSDTAAAPPMNTRAARDRAHAIVPRRCRLSRFFTSSSSLIAR